MREWEALEREWSARARCSTGDCGSWWVPTEDGRELVHESLGWQLGTGGLAACFMSPMVMQAPVVSAVVVRCWA